MCKGVHQPERVHRDVGEMAVPVVNDEVEVDVVGSSKATAGERSRDGDVPDEWRECDKGVHEPLCHLEISGRVGAVIGCARADFTHPAPGGAIDDHVVDQA